MFVVQGPSLFWLLAAGAILSAGCSDDAFEPTLSDPWHPSTVAFDPACETGCVEVFSDNFPHLGELRVMMNPAVDDPIAQWGDCLESLLACLEQDVTQGVSRCMTASSCPAPCVDEVLRQLAGSAELDAGIDAVESVFIGLEAVCRPDAGEVSP